jgi:hypothetical protein
MIVENLGIPAEFTIILLTGRPRHRLAWRIGCEFGARIRLTIGAFLPQTVDAARESSLPFAQ